MEKLKWDIPLILCKLEKIFPPAFFDVMVHLAVHVPNEALLRGGHIVRMDVPNRMATGHIEEFIKEQGLV